MKTHEYQAREILQGYGVPFPAGPGRPDPRGGGGHRRADWAAPWW